MINGTHMSEEGVIAAMGELAAQVTERVVAALRTPGWSGTYQRRADLRDKRGPYGEFLGRTKFGTWWEVDMRNENGATFKLDAYIPEVAP